MFEAIVRFVLVVLAASAATWLVVWAWTSFFGYPDPTRWEVFLLFMIFFYAASFGTREG